MKEIVVSVKDVKKIYGKNKEKKTEALKGINFSVEQGEFIGIMGASGSGKSTLLNLLSTLDQPTSGSVEINHQDISQMRGDKLSDFRAQQIGFIFQSFNLLDNLTASENISLPLSLQNTSISKYQERINKLTKTLGISDVLGQYPTELSGGQKQRVAAVRALVHNPAILLADEPTGALDSKSAKSLLSTMEELNKNEQVSILMVTHDAVSASYCQRILFIKDGKIGQELIQGTQTRTEFYQEILKELANAEQ
ncbi:bacitracin ABC transporter ATP-binding protein [Dellaglioa algida]|nr:bacitracin ABC transporter ATP-binding protein [Dellaglioa algida]